MKVKDLLNRLKLVDPETDIKFALLEGCCGDVEYLNLVDLNVYKLPDHVSGNFDVQFIFSELPGYETCRKAGQMNKLADKLSKETD